jgi:plasmid stability protein
MKNVTIALDDEIHRQARIRAAEMGTSLSALVKGYLTGLVNDAAVTMYPQTAGVREMHAGFKAAPVETPPAPAGPPWLVDGKWVYTPDGKPRQPGALRGKLTITDDFDEWPDGFLDAIYGDDTPASDTWWRTANDRLKAPKGE